MPQHERDEEQTGEGNENREDGSHRAAVERHPAKRLVNSMPRVVVILKRVVSDITIKRATGIMYEAHTKGKVVVNNCHKELAELYEERLRQRGLTVSIQAIEQPERLLQISKG